MSDAKPYTIEETVRAKSGERSLYEDARVTATVEALDAERARADKWEACHQETANVAVAYERERDEWKARAEKAEADYGRDTVALATQRNEAIERAEKAEAEVKSRVLIESGVRMDLGNDSDVPLRVLAQRVMKRAEAAEAALARALERAEDAETNMEHFKTRTVAAEANIAKATEERDAAMKACAETRTMLEAWSTGDLKPGYIDATERALSSDAGKGYLSHDEAKALAEKAWDMGNSQGRLWGSRWTKAGLKRQEDDVQRALDLAALLEGK